MVPLQWLVLRPARLWLYGIVISLSSFLLFQVQPILAKAVLPRFGGAASVWSTCLLFFQSVLVAGYLYAHWSAGSGRLRTRTLIHAGLLAASLALLPLAPRSIGQAGDPALRILALLALSAGVPYLLLSATGPLVQAWCARTDSLRVPYRLFSLSNLASLLALLSYPLVVEPFLSTSGQERLWSIVYVVFAGLCATAAMVSTGGSAEPAPQAGGSRPGWRFRALWLILAACPAALLLAVSNHITQNIAPVPLLWILPLSVYLLSFILCFEGKSSYEPGVYLPLVAAALAVMSYAAMAQVGNPSVKWTLPVFLAGLFVICMFCHGELARRKPPAGQLTAFYVMVASGGALGGAFVALAAPHIFSGSYELPLLLGITAALMLFLLVYPNPQRARVPWTACGAIIATACVGVVIVTSSGVRIGVRNFYGELRVKEVAADTGGTIRLLLHGSIVHGAELLGPGRPDPTTYYSRQSGAGLAIETSPAVPRRVGIVGLGAGTLAAYGLMGDVYRFYEINPLVIQLANSEFDYLRTCPAKIEIVEGDARLSLEQEAPERFDVLAVDAFAGDSIPVHLLTREAFDVYLRHLGRDGVLALHITNHFLDLAPVVAANAAAMGLPAVLVKNSAGPAHLVDRSDWALLTRSPDRLAELRRRTGAEPLLPRPGFRGWTDDYSNLLRVLR